MKSSSPLWTSADEIPLVKLPTFSVLDLCDRSVFGVEYSSDEEFREKVFSSRNATSGVLMPVPKTLTDCPIKYFFFDFSKIDDACKSFTELDKKWMEIVEPFFSAFSVSLNGIDAKGYLESLRKYVDWCKNDADLNVIIIHCIEEFHRFLSQSSDQGDEDLRKLQLDVGLIDENDSFEIEELKGDFSVPRAFLRDCNLTSDVRVPLKSLIKQNRSSQIVSDVVRIKSICKECRIQLDNVLDDDSMLTAETTISSMSQSAEQHVNKMKEMEKILIDPMLSKSPMSVDDAQTIVSNKKDRYQQLLAAKPQHGLLLDNICDCLKKLSAIYTRLKSALELIRKSQSDFDSVQTRVKAFKESASSFTESLVNELNRREEVFWSVLDEMSSTSVFLDSILVKDKQSRHDFVEKYEPLFELLDPTLRDFLNQSPTNAVFSPTSYDSAFVPDAVLVNSSERRKTKRQADKEEMDKLESQVLALQQEKETFKLLLEQKQLELNGIVKQLAHEKRHSRELASEKQNVSLQASSLRNESEILKKKLDEFSKSKTDECSGVLKELESENERLKRELQELTQSLKAAEEYSKQQEKKATDLQALIEDLKKKEDDSKRLLESLKAAEESSREQEKKMSDLQAAIDKLKKSEGELKRTLEEAEVKHVAEIVNYKKRIELLSKDGERRGLSPEAEKKLYASLESLRQQNAELEQQLKQLKKNTQESGDLKDRIEQLKLANLALTQEATALDEIKTELLRKHASELDKLKQKHLSEMKEKDEQYLAVVSEKQKEISKLTASLEGFRKQAANLEGKQAELSSRFTELEKSKKAQSERIAALLLEKNDLKCKLEGTAKRIQQLEGDNEKSLRDCRDLQRRVKELSDENEAFRIQLNMDSDYTTALKTDKRMLESDFNTVCDRASEYRAELDERSEGGIPVSFGPFHTSQKVLIIPSDPAPSGRSRENTRVYRLFSQNPDYGNYFVSQESMPAIISLHPNVVENNLPILVQIVFIEAEKTADAGNVYGLASGSKYYECYCGKVEDVNVSSND